MERDAMLTQLGYSPNEALLAQLEKIENNTNGYEKIRKHIMDLNDTLKIENSFIAMSNTEDYFKIKVEASSPELAEIAHDKIQHFSEKFKVAINKLDNKDTYYIIGFKS